MLIHPKLGRLAFLLALLCIAATLLAGAQTTSTTTSSPASNVSSALALPSIDAKREADSYLAVLQALTDAKMVGRGSGSEGLQRARDYIRAQMQTIGLAPGVGESYFEPFSATLGTKIKEQSLRVTGTGGKVLLEGKGGESFNNLCASKDSFSATLVLAGYGIVNPAWGHNDYAQAEDHPLKGKAVVVFRFEPADEKGKSLWADGQGSWSNSASFTHKVQQAQKREAAALIVVDPPSLKGELLTIQEMGNGLRSEIPVIHVTQDFFRSLLGAAGMKDEDFARLQKEADEGKTELIELKGVELHGTCSTEKITGNLDDVVGMLPGTGELKDQVVIVGAHYDHLGIRPRRLSSAPSPASASMPSTGGTSMPASAPVATSPVMEVMPGADDNASGTAGLFTLARWLADDMHRTKPPSQRTIVFVAFSGEEIGLLGSIHMVEHLGDLKLSREQIDAMINFDMIGRLRSGKLQVLGVDSGQQWRQIIAGVNLPEGISLQLGSSGSGPSDHAAFNRQKIPVLHFFTGMHTDTHSARDTADKINCPGAIDVLQVAQQVLLDVARRPDRIVFKSTAASSRAARTPKPYVGVVLAGADSRVKGCKVGDVNDDSPAKSAGLKAGDIITGWDDSAVGKVDDFFSKVEGSKPGQSVKLKIVRDGKEHTLDLTLGEQ